jgi:intraflagellar transport protein 20
MFNISEIPVSSIPTFIKIKYFQSIPIHTRPLEKFRMTEPQRVIFDSENNFKLVVIEPEQFKETAKLKQSCDEFSTEVGDFMGSVKEFLSFMESQSRRVEDQKLRSIALRNKAQNEVGERKRALSDLQEQVDAKQKTLEQLATEIRSFEEYDRQLQEHTDRLSMM